MANSRFRSLLLALAVVGALASTPLSAQAPRQISYQGVLTTSGGSPVADGTHSVVIKIYSTGGTELFSETHNTSTARGLFNILIGSVNPLPPSLTFSEPYLLGITVDGGAEMSPRTPMASVPYALNGTTINGTSGSVTLQGGGGTTINRVGNTITISSSGGGGGTGIQGVQSSDGSLVVANPNGPTADIGIADGAIGSSKLAANAVTNGKIAPSAVTNDKLANGAVTNAKISGAGASNGQVLSYDGTNVVWSSVAGGGLTLPFSGSTGGAVDAFAVTASGTSRAGLFSVNNAAGTTASIEGTTNSTAGGPGALAGPSGVLGRITPTSPGPYSAGIRGINNGTGGNGIGVIGYQAGSGWGVYGETPNGAGVYGTVSGTTGYGVVGIANGTDAMAVSGMSSLGHAGLFQNLGAANANPALEASTAGTGRAGLFTQTLASNTVPALEATNASTASGAGPGSGPSGIVGRITGATPGAWSAGVRGIVTGAGSLGIGVAGYHQGSGWGVYGESGVTGLGVFGVSTGAGGEGVRGEARAVNGTGVTALYNGPGVGTALSVNGAIRVSGNKAMFPHIATAGNTAGHLTTIDNPMTNGDPDAMLVITHVYVTGTNAIYDTKATSVWYDTNINKWRIYHDDLTAIAANTKWNVLVIKQ